MIIGGSDKIAIFRALQLGDMLNVIPAVRALRKAYPHAEITLLGLPWAASFVRRFYRYFDRFIPFPGYPGLPEQDFDAAAFMAFLEEMHAERFDLLLQMQGNGTIVNELLSQFGAVQLAGFHNARSRMDSPLFVEYPEHFHEIKRHQLLMTQLGIALAGNELEFPLTVKDEEAFGRLELFLRDGSYVCIHPGSRGAWRRWPPACFAVVGDRIAEKGYTVVVTGTTDEAEITSEVISRMHFKVIDLTGRTTLGSMGLLLRRAALLVCNCTGVSHIAAALGTPSVVISMDGEPHRWAPLDHQLHETVDWLTTPDMGFVVSSVERLLGGREINITLYAESQDAGPAARPGE